MTETLFLQTYRAQLEAKRQRDKELGPRKHCRMCGGEHPARACSVVPVTRTLDNGTKVTRFVRADLAAPADAPE